MSSISLECYSPISRLIRVEPCATASIPAIFAFRLINPWSVCLLHAEDFDSLSGSRGVSLENLGTVANW